MDLTTIFLINSSLLFILCVLVLVMRLGNPGQERDSSSYWLAASHICAGTGMLLIGIRAYLPLWLTVLGGNFLILFASALLNRALCRLIETKHDYFYEISGLSLAAMAPFVYYTYWLVDQRARTQVDCVVLFISLFITASQVCSSKWKAIRPGTRVLGYLLFVFCLNNLVRGFLIRNPKLPVAWLLWTSACAVVGITFCYLWIHSLKIRSVLERQALTDPLTGLFNRRAVEIEVGRELYRGARLNQCISALMIDMDRFKLLNDTYGHTIGDRALCAVARALEASIRGADIPARISGDEFVVILPDSSDDKAGIIAERIAYAIAEIRIVTEDDRVATVSCSIGAITLPAQQATLSSLFQHSDKALYLAKSELQSSELQRRSGQI
jgi:diguanylate cyclase (GGDEF)-like protein